MKTQPVTVVTNNGTSTPAKRTLFHIALAVAMIGTVAVATILILHGALALSRFRYFVDIGPHPLHLTSVLLLVFGLIALLACIILTIGIIKVNKTFAVISAVLLGICSLGLIAFSIGSFVTVMSSNFPKSINSTIIRELDQTQYKGPIGNEITVENTQTMAGLEKQHNCCGHTEPAEEYRTRQPSTFGSLNPPSSGGNTPGKGKGSATQRISPAVATAVLLPISCCNVKYRSEENLCIDTFANNTHPINRYNTVGCFHIIAEHKSERIQREAFTTVIAACLAVISCIAIAAVVRLLGEGYQIVPVRFGK